MKIAHFHVFQNSLQKQLIQNLPIVLPIFSSNVEKIMHKLSLEVCIEQAPNKLFF